MQRPFSVALARDLGQTWELYDHLLAVRVLLKPFLQRGYPAYIPFTKAAVEARDYEPDHRGHRYDPLTPQPERGLSTS